jgi:hypothetical protein
VTTQTKQIAADEYQAALDRLRTYRDLLETADRKADELSLTCAADLALLYESKQWAADLPPAKPDVTGKVQPYSRNRFATWVEKVSSINLRKSYTTQLLTAHDLYSQVSTVSAVAPMGAYSLRPLKFLATKGHGGAVPEVWRRAVELAEGHAPTGEQVAQARRDYLAQFTPQENRQRAVRKRWEQAHDRIRAEFNVLLANGQLGVAYDTLNELMTDYETRKGKAS